LGLCNGCYEIKRSHENYLVYRSVFCSLIYSSHLPVLGNGRIDIEAGSDPYIFRAEQGNTGFSSMAVALSAAYIQSISSQAVSDYPDLTH